MIEVGKKAPAFSLFDQDGRKRSLKDFLGKRVVLYFYPKDMTPGCTTQACDFRDQQTMWTQKTAVLGINKDSQESHQKFATKYDLDFPLLSDPEGIVCEKYGVWKEKNLYGRKSMGLVRSTFVIDAEGKIEKIYANVKATGHVARLVKDLG